MLAGAYLKVMNATCCVECVRIGDPVVRIELFLTFMILVCDIVDVSFPVVRLIVRKKVIMHLLETRFASALAIQKIEQYQDSVIMSLDQPVAPIKMAARGNSKKHIP